MKNQELAKLIDETPSDAIKFSASTAIHDLAKLYDAAEALKRKAEEVMHHCINAKFYERKSMTGSYFQSFSTSINSLGELQSMGASFDIKCALLGRSVESLNSAIVTEHYKQQEEED